VDKHRGLRTWHKFFEASEASEDLPVPYEEVNTSASV
jgi:hypothetical protein